MQQAKPQAPVVRMEPLTKKGYRKHLLPQELHSRLKQFLDSSNVPTVVEDKVAGYIPVSASTIKELPVTIKAELHAYFRNICAAWIQDQYMLLPTYVYGLRTYLRNATLKAHRDRIHTHIVSVIVQVDQKNMDEDWPLQIENNEGNWDSMILHPGECLLYEGCRLEHGRLFPLAGESYTNAFIHYALGSK